MRFPESRSTFAKGHYGANWGGGRGPWGEDFAKQRGTYLGVMLTVVTPENKGKVRNISIRDITDGTSFTLAMVEKRDSFGWAVGGWGGSEFDVHTSPASAATIRWGRKAQQRLDPRGRGPTPRCATARSGTCPRSKTGRPGIR